MELSAPAFAALRLLAAFAALTLLLRLRVALWAAILAASGILALASGIMPGNWPAFVLQVLTNRDFVLLCFMIWLIILLSGVQEATGQNSRFVRGLEGHVRSPRVRLVIFPALVGLLPMPGGALFSCPMLKAAAEDMALDDEKKSLINYWFRHIWECAWPLYPGYALACSLLGIPITTLWRYTFPLVFLSFVVGWFFYMRELAASPLLHKRTPHLPDAENGTAEGGESLPRVLLHALPIAVTLVGAGFFGLLFDRFLPDTPGQVAFILSLALAVGTALLQGRGNMTTPLRQLLLTPNARRILLLLAAIFIFKELLTSGGLVRDLSDFGTAPLMVILACITVPLLSGLLTGILVGLVGVSFPIVIGLVEHSTLAPHLLPLIVLALAAGNCGQLLSPLHVCLVVTCEFFTASMPRVWRALLLPALVLFGGGALLAALLALLGARF